MGKRFMFKYFKCTELYEFEISGILTTERLNDYQGYRANPRSILTLKHDHFMSQLESDYLCSSLCVSQRTELVGSDFI